MLHVHETNTTSTLVNRRWIFLVKKDWGSMSAIIIKIPLLSVRLNQGKQYFYKNQRSISLDTNHGLAIVDGADHTFLPLFHYWFEANTYK